MTDLNLSQDSRSTAQVIAGRRINFVYPLVNLVFLGLIVWLALSEAGSWVFAVLLLVLAPILFNQLALLVWPARLVLDAGALWLRCGTTRLGTPLENLAQVMLHGGTLYVVFHDPSAVTPARSSSSLRQTFAQSGVHVRIPGSFFSLAQINVVCRAAGLLEQPIDSLAERLSSFDQGLRSLTPRIWFVPLLLAANVALFAAMVVQGVGFFSPDSAALVDWGANYGPRTLAGQPWRLVTSMFLHAGIAHLAFNMWALWAIGRTVERLTGNLGFAVVYGLSGLGGSLASMIWHPHGLSVGASGAIFGLVGALLALLLRSRDRIPPELWRQLRANAALFVVMNILFGLSVPATDSAAHIGGLIAGFLAGLVVGTPLAGQKGLFGVVRNVSLAAIGTLAVWQALGYLPPPGDLIGALRSLEAAEQRIVSRYNATVSGLREGALREEKALESLQRDLDEWRQERSRLESLVNVPADQRDRIRREVLDLERTLTALIDALRQSTGKAK